MNKLKFTFKSYWLFPSFALITTLIILFSPFKTFSFPYFVVYHSLIEAVCIVISLMIFKVQFILRKHSSSGLYNLLGIPFLGIGILDLLHVLSFKGIPDLVTPNNLQKTILFWLAARFLEAGTFLIFAFSAKYRTELKKEPENNSDALIYAVVLAYISLVTGIALGYPELAPSFVNEQGLINGFKKSCEYLIIISHLLTWYLLVSPKSETWNSEIKNLLASASLTIAISGLSFSSFTDSDDLIMIMGHFFKVVAYYFIFRAALRSELLQPYLHLIEINKDLQLQTESLQNIKDLLVKSERLNAVGMNASRVLHDLNNMVLIADVSAKKIIGLVSEKASAEKIKNYSNTLVSSLAKTQQFQKQLLHQVRSTADHEIPVDLPEELQQFARLLKILAEGNEVAIECEENLKVQINPVELEQVLMNLVVNAADALKGHPEGEIIIGAKRQKVNSPLEGFGGPIKSGNYIKLSVHDNGCGIPNESLSKIFEPFYTTKEGSKGTGLGLSTVKFIVEKWQASLQVNSTLGKGTQFNIFLKDP